MFGGVAILVGAFTIFNTLSITVAQRTREFAMLRMVGAARRQVLGSVLLEALALGLGASIVGIAAGFGIAAGLNAVFGGDRPLAARVGHGVRGADRDRGPAGRHARDAGGRLPAGAAGDEDRSRRRAARQRPGGPQAAAAVADRARRGRARGRSRGRRRRLRRAARAPQRDAPSRPHGRDGERADDRRDARDRGDRGRQRPASGDEGHARRPRRRLARDHRAGRLVADGPGDRAGCRVGAGRLGGRGAAPGRWSCRR